jgi:hypothetical protein
MIKKTIVTKTLIFDRSDALDILLSELPDEEEYMSIDNDNVSISVDHKHVILVIKQEV